MSKDAFYFSHDNTAYTDPKIIELRMKHGIAGYGAFWAILELLHQNANALQTHYERIAFALGLQCDLITSVINDFGLFEFSGDIFFSKRMKYDLEKRKRRSEKASKSATNRWNNANAMRTHSDGNANAMQGKERKGKETKEIKENNESHMNNNQNTKPAEQDEKPTAQELLFRGKLVSQLADNGYPVNMIDHAKHMAALLEFQKVYEAKEHRLYLERPFLDAVLKIYDEFKDKDYYTRILTTTRQYVEYCKRNNRLKKDAVKWLQEGMYMNDWTLNDQPTEKKPAENQPEVFYTKKAKHPDAF